MTNWRLYMLDWLKKKNITNNSFSEFSLPQPRKEKKLCKSDCKPITAIRVLGLVMLSLKFTL